MTREEVRALKVGDIVWFLCVDEEPGTATKAVVTKRADDCDVVTIKCVDNPKCEGHRPWHDNIHKTEVEVYEKAISRAESSIEDSEQSIKNYQEDIKQKKANIENLKEKLAKARAKEQKVWIVDFEEGKVYCSTKKHWENGLEGYEYDMGSDRYQPCPTEQGAYEALAEYYTKKAEEAWIKSGAKFYGGYKTVALLNHIKPIEGSQMVHATSVWNRNCYCGKYSTKNTESEWRISKKSLFDTEAEAYAKMERETPQDVRAEDCADEISERFKAEADAQALEAATRRQV